MTRRASRGVERARRLKYLQPMARKRGAGKGSRVRDTITGRFLKRGTEKRRPGSTVVERLKRRTGRKK
jgi:hypothetical protein